MRIGKSHGVSSPLKASVVGLLSLAMAVLAPQVVRGADVYHPERKKLLNWLLVHRDAETGLPQSHVGDERFENWAITYDSAVVALSYIAAGKIEDAKKILDFISTPPRPGVWEASLKPSIPPIPL